MPGIVAIVAAISSQVVLRLAASGYPPLTDGRILLGRQEQYASAAPPRIIFTPTESVFSAVNVYSRQPGSGPEARAQRAQRSIQTESVRFEVACWGAADSDDPVTVRDEDYDVTQALYHAVLQACAAPPLDDNTKPAVLGPFTAGGVELDGGKWIDATFASAQATAYGRAFTFGLSVATPVLDRLLAYAPAGVHADPKTYFQAPDGTSNQGCGS